MLTTLLVMKYRLLWDNRTAVEATGPLSSSSLDPEKTKISKKEQ